jgi:flagellar protein FliL
MAEPKKSAEAEASAAAPPKKKGKLLIIIAVVLVVLAGGGGGAFFYMKSHAKAPQAAKETKKVEKPAIYYPLDPPFVVNFQGEQAVRFLQVAVQVLTREPETAELLKQHDPVVKNDLLMLFGGQKYEDLSTRAGKEKLQKDALASVRSIIEKAGGKPESIEALYFTSFVMQ